MDESTQDIEALEGLADPEAARALAGTLEALAKDTEILLFMGPGCAVCPHQLRSAATVALASPRVVLDVVYASEEPELAARYEVQSVPTTVVDDELIMVGVVPPAELAMRLVERQSPDDARRVFIALVQAGRQGDAAERLADGRGTAGFLELWGRSTPEQRVWLLKLAEESLLYDPWGLEPLLPGLTEWLEGDGPPADDAAWRADTAELLGVTAAAGARPVLERLADDASPEVAGAAGRALAALDDD